MSFNNPIFRTVRLQRYVLLDCISFFVLALCAFTGVLLTVQLLRLSDLVVNRGVNGGDIAMIFLAIIPTFLELALPMAAVVGVMLAISRLSTDAELIVMRASGISLYQILPAVFIFGIGLGVIGIEISQELKPWGHRTVNELLFKIARDRTTAGLEPGVFNKLGQITLYPEQINYQTGELTRVLLDQRDASNGRRVFFAKHGIMTNDPVTRSLTLELHEGEMHEQSTPITTKQNAEKYPLKPSTSRTDHTYSVTSFDSESIDIGPELLGTNDKDTEAPIKSLSREQLLSSKKWYKENSAVISGAGSDGIPLIGDFRTLIGQKTDKELSKRMIRIDTELALRTAAPFSALVLALVAFPLGVQPPRGQSGWGAGASLGVGLAVFMLYYGLLFLGFALAENRTIPSLVAVWVPNLVAAAVAVVLNRAVCSERVQSIGEYALTILSYPTRIFR